MDLKAIFDERFDELHSIVGDTPVAEQLNAALSAHIHNNYVPREEFVALKQQVEQLSALVGDTPVATQIAMAVREVV